MTHTYSQDGVNVAAGDTFSAYAGSICKHTAKNNPNVLVHDMTAGKFRGPRWYTLQNLPDGCYHTTVNDGIGTKVELHDAAGSYSQAARDVIAMTGSDITRYGGYPLVFTSVLDVATIGEPWSSSFLAAQGLIDGLAEVVKEQNLVVFNGETAELWSLIGTNNKTPTLAFNWAWTMEWVYHPQKMILGDKISDGDIVIALQEKWFRSNGISSVRKAFAMKFGEHRHAHPDALPYIQKAAEPSVIYDIFLSYINWWTTPDYQKIIDVHGIVHLSGGSFEGKLLDDVLSWRNLEAHLDNLFDLPEIMRDCATWRWLDDADLYRTRHGWQWMLVIVSASDVDIFIEEAKKYNIEAQAAWVINATSWASRVVIESMFTKWETVVFDE